MTIHQCPKCELRFERKTELDDHCWHDHPEFRHEYPVGVAPHPVADPEPAALHAERTIGAPAKDAVSRFFGWLIPRKPSGQLRGPRRPSGLTTEQRDGMEP
jgi:hypothetical protein